ncbi:MAG: hypothetical protein LBD12_07660 [Clostridiales Family XIII bacterium]|jgi:hypothetical protein|nr:hypothetical protein [Clostridiales Family XIII bacterium]
MVAARWRWQDCRSLGRQTAAFEEVDRLYRQNVVPFENTDDEYALMARGIQARQSSVFEDLFGGLADAAVGIKDFSVGVSTVTGVKTPGFADDI